MNRGLRNNNPLNIRHGRSRWAGMRSVQTDPSFVQFESMEMGYRAAFIVLQTYRRKYTLRTLRQIIFRWAPPHENHTYTYLLHVCLWSGIKNPDHVLRDEEMPLVVAAMHRQECGTRADMKQVMKGWQLAQATHEHSHENSD